jgi:hypothetical protein
MDGRGFRAAIVFDEAHEMGGVAGGEGRFGATKGSSRASPASACKICPRARLYASATGASTSTISLMRPLGLWGPQTAFADRGPSSNRFAGRHRRDGTGRPRPQGAWASMPRARSASPASNMTSSSTAQREQIAVYDAYADAWAIYAQLRIRSLIARKR